MPETKYEYYAALAKRTARQLTDSLENWTAFLDTAARLYKYPYHEQLMIYAQRPDATACADYDTWSKTMRRYIRRGTKGIALIDHDADTPKLKYVYDLADTGIRQNSRPVNLWQMGEEHMDTISYMLDQNYGVADGSFTNVFEEISANLAEDFLDNHRRDIIGIVENSFLEEYTDDTIGVRFREAVTVSTTYTIMARCGIENSFTHEDFLPIFEFNTPDTIAALGTAVSEISEQILRDIEIAIKTYERMKEHETEQPDLHENERLRVPEPDLAEPAAADIGQVRENAPGIFEESPSDSVQSPDSGGETALSFDGDRHDSEPSIGADDGRADESERSDGTDEVGEPDAVGADDEQPEIAGGGNDSERADFQLSEPTPFSRGEQISLFDSIPTEAEQIEYIDKAESKPRTPFAFSFSQEEIDTVLKYGSNADNSRMRIVAEFMKEKSVEAHADFLKKLFHGGNGFKVDGREICAWYADDGIHLAQGRSARYVQFAQVISWQEAAERVGQMLDSGTFASNVELAEAVSHAQRQLSIDLWNLHSYFSDEARGNYFSPVLFDGSFDESVTRIAGMLAEPSMRDVITNELARLAADYAQNRDLLRFHHAPPANLIPKIRELADMTHEYTTDMTELPMVQRFITEDEINESFIEHGSGFHDGKYRIYEYLTAQHTDKEKIAFLKNEYGTGGHSHALSGATGSSEDRNHQITP